MNKTIIIISWLRKRYWFVYKPHEKSILYSRKGQKYVKFKYIDLDLIYNNVRKDYDFKITKADLKRGIIYLCSKGYQEKIKRGSIQWY